ncbi:MAG: sigma-70 family RNA polymerase sigma factor [Planctomycetia bacterium]
MTIDASAILSNSTQKTIRLAAKSLIGKCGITKSDLEDIHQEISLDLLERLPKFDPGKAKWTTFVQRVVKHKVVVLLRERCTENGTGFRTQQSIEKVVAQDEFENDVTLGQTLLNTKYPSAEWTAEVKEALESLPESHRVVFNLLVEGFSMRGIARHLNIPRTTLRDVIIRDLRETFDFLKNSNFPSPT